jgi:hypothetical protein
MGILLLLVVLAFALTIASAIGKCPLWVPVLLLALERMLSLGVPFR